MLQSWIFHFKAACLAAATLHWFETAPVSTHVSFERINVWGEELKQIMMESSKRNSYLASI